VEESISLKYLIFSYFFLYHDLLSLLGEGREGSIDKSLSLGVGESLRELDRLIDCDRFWDFFCVIVKNLSDSDHKDQDMEHREGTDFELGCEARDDIDESTFLSYYDRLESRDVDSIEIRTICLLEVRIKKNIPIKCGMNTGSSIEELEEVFTRLTTGHHNFVV
jgi:hypothetical protein